MSRDVLKRLQSVWQARGAAGFGRFMLSKLYTKRRDLLFEIDTDAEAADGEWNGIGTLLCVGKENVATAVTPQMLEQIFAGEGADYLPGLKKQDLLFCVLDDKGNFLHHSFVLFDTRTKHLLGEPAGTPLFAHCVTRADARGMHLFSSVLRRALAVLAKRGHSRAIVNCDPANLASIAGIRRAGFRLVRSLETQILLSFVARQETERSEQAKTRFFVI